LLKNSHSTQFFIVYYILCIVSYYILCIIIYYNLFNIIIIIILNIFIIFIIFIIFNDEYEHHFELTNGIFSLILQKLMNRTGTPQGGKVNPLIMIDAKPYGRYNDDIQ